MEADEWYKTNHMLMSDQTIIPVGIIRERFTSYSSGALKLTNEQLRLVTILDFYKDQKEKLANVKEMKSSKFGIESKSDSCKLTANYILIEEIGVEKFFEVEDNRKNSNN